MSDVYEPRWIEKYWKHMQVTLIVLVMIIVQLVFWFLSISFIGTLGYFFMIAYIVLTSDPPGGTAKQRWDQDQHRLSLYISVMEDFLADSESPVETFHLLVKRFIETNRFTKAELSLIVSHFAGRADDVGKEVRRLIRDDELDSLSGS